jgi:hypothetical protein
MRNGSIASLSAIKTIVQGNKELFKTFSDARLIEIVKNAGQFGYDDSIRSTALQVLKERNISEEDLQLTGNLTNYKFDYTRVLFRSYTTNSRIAFFSYLVLVLLKVVAVFRIVGVYDPPVFYTIIYWAIFILYLVVLVKSFLDHVNFYKSVGKELGVGDQIIFFVLGMPLYIVMFFFYRSRMKEEMQMIN